ncbi:MAG: tRNA pseudouridine(38-40) synthase TruA [Dehalococcoidia bacterium]
MPTVRFAATVSYDGTDFSGSQRQPNGRTVQEVLEASAAALFGTPTRVDLAGRTDAGVHAKGQVAALSAETALEPTTVGRALNARLPADVAVRDVRIVPEGFDPRRWARSRWYRYTIWDDSVRAPLLRRSAWHVGSRLKVAAMDAAAQSLVGRHDFQSCTTPLEPGKTSVRTVSRAGWHREGDTVLFDIEADAFLQQMVRRIVGGLVQVGRGALTVEGFGRLLGRQEAGAVGPTAPPHGLCLERVEYHEGYVR